VVSVVRNITTADRFWAKVNKADECWLWTGYIKPNGYATFYPGGGRHVDKVYVHRWAYEATRGPIPEGLEVDHLCNVRHCVNPAHLEAVSRRENLDRRNDTQGWQRLPVRGQPRALKTHCKHGHAFDEVNTYWHSGYRYCRACRASRGKARAA
jgi:hypothetical protein